MIKKQKILRFFEYAVIFFVILDTSTVYSTAMDINFHIPESAAVLIIICLAMRLSFFGIKKWRLKKYFKCISLYYMVILFLLFMNVRMNILSYISRFMLILPLLILYFYCLGEKGESISFIHKYVDIMAVLSAISLFFWLFASQFHLIAPTGSLRSGWGDGQYGYFYPSYFGLYFERQMNNFLWYSGFRNQGIFAEAPMFSLCIVFAIAVELFLSNQKTGKAVSFSFRNGKGSSINWRLACLIVALITTITTTGQVLLLLILVLVFFKNKPKTKFNYMIKLLLGISFAAVCAWAAVSIFLLKSTSSSWMIRSDDFFAGFHAWLSSPIWGHGYGDITVLDPYKASFRVKGIYGGFSNSITMVLAQGGILFLLIYILPVYKTVRNALLHNNSNILSIVVVLIIEFIFTIYAYTLVALLFLAFLYGMSISSSTVKSTRITASSQQMGTR